MAITAIHENVLTRRVPGLAREKEDGHCRDFNYDPLILPEGVAPSDDPLLSARSAAYSVSFQRRAAEGPRPDAITLELQHKGEVK